MPIEHYTVVYRVDGGKAEHDQWWATIAPLFRSRGNEGPIRVVAVSVGDALDEDAVREAEGK